MPKTDFKKTLDVYKARQGEFRLLDVPPMQYLMVDGHGDPNSSPEYTDAISALYPLAYKLKFSSKQQLERDYVVMPLEGLWWADDMESFTSARDKSKWHWTLMIMTPDWITREMFDAAVAKLASGDRPAALERVRLEAFDEGRCVQTLHIGAYDDEAPVLDRMHNVFMPQEGQRMRGRHHEIYLSDARRTPPVRLRTILRQPVEEA